MAYWLYECLKQRALIRPDLNKQYALLWNPSIPVSSYLFRDELNKEVEELTKSDKLSNKVTPKKRMEPYKVSSSRGVCGPSRLSESGGRGKILAISFLGWCQGQTWSQKNPKQASTTEVSWSTVVKIIASQTTFKAGGLQYFLQEWK